MKNPFIKKEEINIATEEPVPLQQSHVLERQVNPGIDGNRKVNAFIREFYPGISKIEWNDWQWQVRHSITKPEDLARILDLQEEELLAIAENDKNLPLRITPYFANLIWKTNFNHPLRKTVVPQLYELINTFGEDSDPLHEETDSPVHGIVHRYPDRVLFLATSFCSTYCRYCTRSRLVGDDQHTFNPSHWNKALEYIETHTGIRDVLLSGGDPLTMSDERIEYLLARLRNIPHVEIIRIGTKVPVVLPQRITTKLVRILKKFHPLFMSLHFIHPEEISRETAAACTMLADAGIPLGSQTVLLKGINDNVPVMTELMHRLLKIRVKPYYLYQCDPIPGSGHFRTSIQTGLDIIKGMRGFTSGYAIPHYVVDAPGGGGKIPLLPAYAENHDDQYLYLRSFDGGRYKYPDPL